MHITPQPKPQLNQIWSSSHYILGDTVRTRRYIIIGITTMRIILARCNIDGAVYQHPKREYYRKQQILISQFNGRANAFTFERISRYTTPPFIMWDGG